MRILLTGFVVTVLVSCNSVYKNPAAKLPEDWVKWKTLTLNYEIGNKTVGKFLCIVDASDTLYYYDYRNATYDNETKKFLGVKTHEVLLSKAERDSVFKYSYMMIAHPQHDLGWVTDYGGEYLDISLSDRIVTIDCKYVSIGNINKIDLMQKLRALTFDKIKTD